MSTANSDVRSTCYVLRRTNYGEADRILNLITPEGRMTVIAKGVRKEKSKLAGNIEMFSLIDFVAHRGHSEFAVLTSAKMLKFFSRIITDLSRMELAAFVLKKISIAAEHSDNPDYFKIVDQTLAAINSGYDLGLIETWFLFNYLKACGEQINLYRDTNGEKLEAGEKYEWDFVENALARKAGGSFGENEIKMMRLLVSSSLGTALKVKDTEEMAPGLLRIARALNKL